jgi:hypothetical protein
MTAEIFPFPLRATQSWRYIAETYARRRDKAAYAKGVIDNNIERMQRLGVAPERAAAEIRELESLFARLDEMKQQQERQATA